MILVYNICLGKKKYIEHPNPGTNRDRFSYAILQSNYTLPPTSFLSKRKLAIVTNKID